MNNTLTEEDYKKWHNRDYKTWVCPFMNGKPCLGINCPAFYIARDYGDGKYFFYGRCKGLGLV